MKLNNKLEIDAFLKAVDSARGEVYLTSVYGDKYNLKSVLSKYVAIGDLIKNEVDLELFCANKDDEHYFLKFFKDHPDTV